MHAVRDVDDPRTAGVKCLFLTPFLPYPPIDGGRVRMLRLIERMANRHDVDVLSLAAPTDDIDIAKRALEGRGIRIEVIVDPPPSPLRLSLALMHGRSLYAARYRSRALATALDDRLARGGYDVIQCEFPYTGQFRVDRAQTRAAWVLDAHNVEHRLSGQLARLGRFGPYSVYAQRETRARRREEIAICRSMNAVVTVSEADRDALTRTLPGLDAVVVPNGVDVARITPGGRESSRPTGVFIGKLDYRPNVDGLRWFSTSILPIIRNEIDDFELIVAGSGSDDPVARLRDVPGVTVLGEVLDVLTHLQSAWLVPVPVRAGSGTRLKILEALSAGKAVITTTIGCEGLDARPERHLVVADDPAAFAAEVVRLCRDPALRRRLGDAGRALVEARYDWDSSAEVLDALYHRLVDSAAVEAAAG